MSLYRNINKRKKAGTSRSKKNQLYQQIIQEYESWFSK